MTLPSTFFFLKPGWWVVHLAAPALIFGGGIGLGIYHARGHGQGPEGGGPGMGGMHAKMHGSDAAAGDCPMGDACPGGANCPMHAATAAPAASAGPSTAPSNPIKDEMAALKVAFDVLNESVIMCRSDGVVEAFHAVHAKRAATEKALEEGTVAPPRNAAQMDKFIARDEAFHVLVEQVVAAAEKDELDVLKVKSIELRDACVACHSEFR